MEEITKEIGWILLMGLGRESAHWGGFPDLLRTAFPGSVTLAIDLPGTGVYWKGVACSSPQATVEFVRAAAIKQGFKPDGEPARKWYVLGLSLGAMVGWQWLTMYPKDFAAAIFVNMSLPRVNSSFHRLSLFGYRKILQSSFARTTADKETAILEMVSNSAEVRHRLHPEWVHIQHSRPVSPANAMRQILVARSIEILEEKPHDKVLLAVSDQDRMVSPRCSHDIQRRWDLPLVIHPWAGHGLSGDDPGWLVQQIKVWLESVDD